MSDEQEKASQAMHDWEDHRQREQLRAVAELEKCERLTQAMHEAEELHKENIIRWLQFSEHYDTSLYGIVRRTVLTIKNGFFLKFRMTRNKFKKLQLKKNM